MNAKTIIRIVLLAVIAVAVGRWAMKEFGPAKAVSPSVTRPDGVTVINFHGAKRCRTCIGIGELAKKTIDEDFAAQLKSGQIRWEQINYDETPNAHYVKDYGLVSSTILITLWKDGKEVKWSRLDEVWDHYGDETAFQNHLIQSVHDLYKATLR
jgi:hypothetical protein